MDIKVGEYGRTNKGNIFIYANVVDEKGNKLDYIMKLVDGRPIKYYLSKDEQIVKHSFNIIDLLENGDVVTFKIGSMEAIRIGIVHKFNDARSGEKVTLIDGYKLEDADIKEILTHEQFKANCYKIEQK